MFPTVLNHIISKYAGKYKLLQWIDEHELSWNRLSENPVAIDLLAANPNKIYWDWLSRNPSIFFSNSESIFLEFEKLK